MLKAFMAAIAIFTVNLAPSIGPDNEINGMIEKLNKPGTIAVQITVGDADGVQQGDKFVVQRKKKDIGKLLIIHVDEETAMANIIAVDNKLEIGDLVVHK